MSARTQDSISAAAQRAHQDGYVLDPSAGVWMRPGAVSPADHPENDRIGELIRQTRDLASGSEELLALIHDWETAYHLGPERSSVLRPVLPLLRGRVLEVGAGCGAITRFLGESAAEVIALEPDFRQAAMAAARCAGLPNVAVYCDRLDNASVPAPFDCITLIGALEHAPALFPSGDSLRAMLEHCRSLLAPDGILLVAGANRLALKYFAGAPEEHTGGVFDGITGLDAGGRSRSYTKPEIERALAEAGYRNPEFLYPFPDYRLARLVLHPRALQPRVDDVTIDLVQQSSAYYDPRWRYERLFSERLAWANILRNGLAEDLAPSFLIVASPSGQAGVPADILGYTYAVMRRRCFQKETILLSDGRSLHLRRRKLYDEQPPAGLLCRQELHDEEYSSGRLWANELCERLDHPGWTFQTILDWLMPYVDFLLRHSENVAGGRLLPANFQDCTPFNVVREADGSFQAFDLEWIWGGPFPLDFLLFRGLIYTLHSTLTVAPPANETELRIVPLTLALMKSAGFPATSERLQQFFILEENLQKDASGEHVAISREYWAAARLSVRIRDVGEELARRDTEIAGLQERERESAAVREQLADRDRRLVFEGEQAARREARIEELSREAGRAEERSARLALQLSGAEADLEDASRALAAAKEELAAERRTAQKLRADTNRLQLQGRDQARRLSEASLALAAAKAERQRLESAIAELRRFLAEASRILLRQHSELTAANAALAEHAAGMQRALAELQSARSELELLQRSGSWRATRPLRAFMELAQAAAKWGLYPAMRLRAAWLYRTPEVHRAGEVVQKSGIFDAAYYVRRNPEVDRSGIPPFLHYILWGAAEGRSPNLLFDPKFLRAQWPAAAGSNDLVRWIEQGAGQGHPPHPLFDYDFYVRLNPQAAEGGQHPLAHFLNTGGRQGLDPHPLFDCSWYLQRYPDAAQSGMNPLVHYLLHGHAEGRMPHPLFDSRYYCEQNVAAAQGGADPLSHYVVHGAQEAFSPHPLFDSAYYKARYPEIAAAEINPLRHYLEWGAAEGRSPHPLFDPQFYLAQIPDPPPGCNPVLHYLETGGAEELNPHPLFDSGFYRRQRPDLDLKQITLLEHYLRHGWKEDSDPHPLFDSAYYLQQNPDVAAAGLNPLGHYLTAGSAEGRRPNALFDPAWYRRQYPDVARAGVDPLVHYSLQGAAEGKNPGPLFDTVRYRKTYPDVVRARMNPLAHYLRHGMAEGRTTVAPSAPHPGKSADFLPGPAEMSPEIEAIWRLFDVEYYLRQAPHLAESRANPYEHYLQRGAREGLNPHPLFDTSFYLEHNPDVRQGGMNPLLHFALHGGAEARDPHPLFDCEYYFEKYPDVKKAGLNPLLHYLEHGAAEGRNPNRMFDSRYYLTANADVRLTGANPLVHFALYGYAENRDPHPAFDIRYYLSQHPEVDSAGGNALVHYLGKRRPVEQAASAAPPSAAKAKPADCFRVEALDGAGDHPRPFSPARTILCVTHVSPYPPRAGNEYGEYRQLDYLERHGYRIVIALSPLPGEELSPQQFRKLAQRFPYSILCGRDGVLQHRLPDGQAVLQALDGLRCEPLPEPEPADDRARWLAGTERDFCPDFLARLAVHLEAALSPCVVLSQYVFQTRFLALIGGQSLKAIQTHDMFSTKQKKVIQFGVQDGLNLSPEQERSLLLRADWILSCQRVEAQEFAALVPERQVLEVPLDFDVVEPAGGPEGAKILYVGSDNAANTKGMRDFLQLAWPAILRHVPQAELLVAGKICRTIPRPPDNVRLLGLVDDLDPLYQQARLTINPSVAGTGLKIKTAESLSHFRPPVGWPSGADGFAPELAALCRAARDWHEFTCQVISILQSDREEWFSAEQKDQIRRLLSPDSVYGELLKRLNAYSEQHKLPAAASPTPRARSH